MYKAVWVRRIISTLQLLNIPYKKSKINWENIFCLIQGKKLGIYNVENIPNLYDASSSKTTTSRVASEESSSSSGESSMMNQALLEPEDKIAIEELYKNLNPMNMWKLSSVFTKEDLKEIKTFKLKRLPNLPTDLENYFNSLLLLSTENDLDKLYTDVKAANFHPRNDEALAWAQTTVLNTIKLFMSNYFPLSDQSEADILRRIWLLIDTVFDYSAIKSRRYNAPPIPSGPHCPEDDPCPVDTQTVHTALLKRLSRRKAPGCDHLRTEMLLPIADDLVPVLTLLFRLCWIWSAVPAAWCTAQVVPIYKKGDPLQPANYRPISLTSVLRKLFELCLQTTLENTAPSLNPVQGGFRHSRSALDQALCLNELCRQHAIDHHGESPVLAFLDIKSAYDTVDRAIIWRALETYFFIRWPERCTKVNGKKSRHDENNSTKELSDGMFKIPLIMKDMFNSLAKKTPLLVNDITISSLMIMETKISLIIMDSPGALEYDLGEDPPIPPTFHKNLKRKRDFAEDDNHKSDTEEFDTASNA
ncbi:hypothetical protein G6F64_011523 [Rhizopus arrhizus]|uniref:Reverse transcriptase domain-containing protein n=1 Tax=Rhizopus oryzae TaxID=64495 RepID=A0A9P7BMK3_RHIOR|nr:hypothetical protein G6F64_011523 [Rhizopus arrhizus]